MQVPEMSVVNKLTDGQVATKLTLMDLLTQMEQIDAAIVELTPEGMAELADRLELKVDSYNYFLTKLEAEAARLKGMEDQVKAARQAVERKHKQLEDLLVFTMQSKGFTKLPGEFHQVALKSSKSVKPLKDPSLDIAVEHPEYVRIKYEWDKIALTAALKKKDPSAEALAKFEERFTPELLAAEGFGVMSTSLTTLMPSGAEWAMMKEQADVLIKTGFLPPSIKTPEQALAIMLFGRELGIAPMQAFKSISIINGKPCIGAELMLSLIYRKYPTADIRYIRNDKDGAEVHVKRPGKEHVQKFEFTKADAELAGLLSKGSWRQYPRDMYRWRAVSAMARACFPECLMGASHTPEEMGAEVNAEGEVIEAEVVYVPEPQPEPAPAPPKPVVRQSTKGFFNKSVASHRGWLIGKLQENNYPASIHKDVEKALHNRPFEDAREVAQEIFERAQGETQTAAGG